MVAIYRSFQMPPESLNYLFALARTGYGSEFFSDFGKVTKIGIKRQNIINVHFFLLFLESILGGESTLGVCEIGQKVKIFR